MISISQVHERQTERMRTRSEWFLSHSPHASPLPPVDVECQPHAVYILRSGSINRPPSGDTVLHFGFYSLVI